MQSEITEEFKKPGFFTWIHWNLRAVLARAYVRVVALNREPVWLIFDVLMPLLSLSAYVFVYKALNAPPEFAGFVILGGAMAAYWLNVVWSMMSQFFWERMGGQLELFMITPISRMSILIGMATGGLLSTTVRAGGAFFLGVLIFKVPFHVSSWLHLIVIFVLTMAALYGMGMLFASLFLLWGREAWHLASLMEEPIYLLSGFYFPVKALGYVIALIASLIPATLGLDGMRQLFYGARSHGFLPIETEIGVLVILTLVFLISSKLALDLLEKLAKKTGTLTKRWQ